MKTRALVMAGVMALTAMASTRIAQAQETVIVNIPFDFAASKTMLPAGEYSVTVSGPTHSLILISRKDSAASAFINTNAVVSVNVQSESKLVFNRYGSEYFLSTIWDSYAEDGRQVRWTAREKELAKRGNVPVRAVITLASSK